MCYTGDHDAWIRINERPSRRWNWTVCNSKFPEPINKQTISHGWLRRPQLGMSQDWSTGSSISGYRNSTFACLSSYLFIFLISHARHHAAQTRRLKITYNGSPYKRPLSRMCLLEISPLYLHLCEVIRKLLKFGAGVGYIFRIDITDNCFQHSS